MSDACGSCGYSLNGLPIRGEVIVCPECGEAHDPLNPEVRHSWRAMAMLWLVNCLPALALGTALAFVELRRWRDPIAGIILACVLAHLILTPAISTTVYAHLQWRRRRYSQWRAIGLGLLMYLDVALLLALVMTVWLGLM